MGELVGVLTENCPYSYSEFFEIRLSGFLKNPDIFLKKCQKCVGELKFCMNELFNNVFKAFSFLKFREVFFFFIKKQNDLLIQFKKFGSLAVSQLGWLKVKFLIVVNMEFKYFTWSQFFSEKSKILRFDVFLT
jgi:hypothetical protein